MYSALITRYEFGNRRELWKPQPRSPLLPVANFGARTGMSRNRFDDLFSAITFSKEKEQTETEVSSIRQRWSLVQGFIDAFNRHRVSTFRPSELLCADESISRWYGLGGEWIEVGLPHYVKIDPRPGAGCKLQNSCCGRSGITLYLERVSTAEDESEREYEEMNAHGTAVLKRLTKSWAGSNRLVCADSYYVSVDTAESLAGMGLRFIDVVKQETSKYPIKYLSEYEMENRGEWHTVVRKNADDNTEQMTLVWMYRQRMYFIATAGTDLPGIPYSRMRWRQLTDGARRVEYIIEQPKIAEMYYSAFAKIDQHNRCRQDDLMMGRKIGTKDWLMQVNKTIVGMIIVDAWLVYRGESG